MRSWLGVIVAALLLAAPGAARAGDGGPTFPGFQAQTTGDIYGQVKVFDDIDGDGKKDVVFGATDGQIHVYSANGKEIMAGLWPKHTGGPILADVNVADLDGDGKKDVLVGSYDGKVYALNTWGKEKWAVDTRGTIQLSAPEVGDMDQDGKLDVLIGSRSGKIFRIDADGRVVWEVPMSSKVSSRVVLVDLDGDGNKELVTKDDNGKVTVLNTSGAPLEGWPQSTVPSLEWPFEVAAADLQGDGPREIFTTTPDKRMIIWNMLGKPLKEFKLTDGAHCAPRVGDFDGDGKPDFLIAQADGTVLVMNQDGKALPGFPYKTNNHSIYSTPHMIDIDGDGRLDVVFNAWNPNGAGKEAGYIMALGPDGRPLQGYPKFIGKTIAPLTFADLDGDGYLEMIAAGGINYTDKQLQVFPTGCHIPMRMAVLGTEVTF